MGTCPARNGSDQSDGKIASYFHQRIFPRKQDSIKSVPAHYQFQSINSHKQHTSHIIFKRFSCFNTVSPTTTRDSGERICEASWIFEAYQTSRSPRSAAETESSTERMEKSVGHID